MSQTKTTSNPLQEDASVPRSLQSQLNWLNFAKKSDLSGICEYPFFSDAHITGEQTDGFGPYTFLNTVPIRRGEVNSPIVIRVAFHLDKYRPQMSKTDDSLYHGGSLVDEIAALASLAMGVRFRAGGETRLFEIGKDPLGRPRSWNDQPKPVVMVRRNEHILPDVIGTHSMNDLDLLKTIPSIASDRYVKLIRASRFYQDALWVAESEPNLAWLMLVSALEIGANDVFQSEATPVEQLRDWRPQLGTILEETGGSGHLEQVAEIIARCFGATKKFLDFTLRNMPTEREKRPTEEWMRVTWSPSGLKKVLNKVYEYRSNALHGGIPFPAPMLEPPFHLDATSGPSEVPLTGLASHARGGTWLPKDCPINLHCFHYVARGALLSWWGNLSNDRVQSGETEPPTTRDLKL
jgi:hypothetical protein